MGARFNIIVVGGGLAGLATAFFLRRNGHIVTVVEASRQLSGVGAAIQIPPNGTRILHAYGLAPQLEEVSVKPSHVNMRRYVDGAIVRKTPLVPEMVDGFGFPYLMIHQAECLDLLHEVAVEAGVMIRLSSRVVSVDSERVSVCLADGTTLSADLIVGADGIGSEVRASILRHDDVRATSSSDCMYSAIVPRELMMSHPSTAELMDSPATNCWFSPDTRVMAYPICGGTQCNIIMSYPSQASVEKLNEPGNVEEMNEIFEIYDPVVRCFLRHVKTMRTWLLADMPPLKRWRSTNGRVLLVGDAAHAMLPYLSQGAAQAIEDGAVLAECLIRAGHTDDLRRLTEAYETLRKGRAERIQARSRLDGVERHADDGKKQGRRDGAMQGSSKDGNVNRNIRTDKKFQSWLLGHDAVREANEILERMLRHKQTRYSRL